MTLAAVDIARIHRLRNPVRHYAWGSRTAIPELLGQRSPASEPCAELWIGAHPTASSIAVGPDGEEPLSAFIARDPEAVLGRTTAARFDGALPFLLKVLAASEPLSIQTHPDRAKARAGFERENRAGVPLDAPNRNYRDPDHKPELICALTRFQALNRFRDPREITEHFGALAVPALEPQVAALRERPERERLAAFFGALWTLGKPAVGDAIERGLTWARARGDGDPAARWLLALARRYPGDIGVLAPLLLNVVELEPGEAMFLPAGEVHSYLEGVGIEIMANSDNVLRGGLTAKPIDVPELLRTLTFDAGPVERLRARRITPSESRYDAPVEEFELGVIAVRPGAPYAAVSERQIELLLCTAGRGRIIGSETQAIERGVSFVVPASAAVYTIEGDLTLYRAAPAASARGAEGEP